MNTGGPAFPRAGCDWTEDHGDGAWAQEGMTLRDYFAAKAMQSMLGSSNEMLAEIAKDAMALGVTPQNLICRQAYLYADAMISEREKQ